MNQMTLKGKTPEQQAQPGEEGQQKISWLMRKRQPRQLGSRCFVPAMMRTSLRLGRERERGE
jgi:hypothetical protein